MSLEMPATKNTTGVRYSRHLIKISYQVIKNYELHLNINCDHNHLHQVRHGLSQKQ